MASLNGIASFVDTLGRRNFNWTHKKVIHIFTRNKTCIHIFKYHVGLTYCNIHGKVHVGNFRLQLQTKVYL